MFDPGLRKGDVVSNRQIMDIFHCACEGGIRYASKTDTIVLVVNNTKKGLPNVRVGNRLLFSGRPLKAGSGSLSGANKRLEEFIRGGKDIFLFEVNRPDQYQYRGRVRAGGEMMMEKSDSGSEYPVFPLDVD